jgi:hypothetical protein
MYWGVEEYLHHFWPRHQMELSAQLNAPAALTPHPRYPLDRRLGGASQPVWTLWRK